MFQRPQQLMKHLSFLGYTVYYEDIGSFPQSRIKNLWDNFYLCQGISPLTATHPRPRILWMTFPHHVDLIRHYQPDYVVFDCSDEPKDEFSNWGKSWPAMLSKADLVFASSTSLFDQLKNQHPAVVLLRNGVDFEHFTIPQNRPPDLPEKKPLIGYSGAIAPWLDWKLLQDVISRNPTFHFIFLGALVKLRRFPLKSENLSYLGLKSYSTLPSYLQQFNVSLIPFKLTDMTKGCNPIKLYEYTAVGSPIVATPLPELTQVSCPGIYLASDPIHFSKALEKANLETTSQSDRKFFAAQNDWKKRALAIHHTLQKYYR